MAVNVFQAGRFGNPRFEIWPASVPRRWIDFRGPGVETIQAINIRNAHALMLQQGGDREQPE